MQHVCCLFVFAISITTVVFISPWAKSGEYGKYAKEKTHQKGRRVSDERFRPGLLGCVYFYHHDNLCMYCVDVGRLGGRLSDDDSRRVLLPEM